MAATALRIENLTYRYGDKLPLALSEFSATIRPGIITGLVGPDGAGKTTLMRLLSALLLPSSGSITVFGLNTCTAAEELHQIIGYMPQKFALYEELSVLQNLRLYADLHRIRPAERQHIFQRLLAFTGLEPFQQRLAGRLSGGMKQKLGLACALIRKPRLLLLDEPSVGVDPLSRRELWSMVRELVDAETAVLWSTAYLDEAELCQEVLLLDGGRLLFSGDPAALTARVDGRCFQVQGITGNRRQVLTKVLQQEAVQDGIIQGQHVRMVLRAGHEPPPVTQLNAGTAAHLVPVAARFEDAYIDIVRGETPRGHSGISALTTDMTSQPTTAEFSVEAENLIKTFGTFSAVNGISFSIRRGEIFGLLGPNGAGKSTTFKMLCGLMRPSSGTGRVAGLDLLQAPGKARARLGYMAQKFSLYGDLSLRQNLDFFSGVYGLKGEQQKNSVARMIDIFALQPHLHACAKDLPLGFKQRLALACSLMHEPAVLFLDEPTSGVDPLTRREFWTHINGLVEHGVTVLVTTHFMDEAEYCDRIGLIYRGQMIATGSPDALKAQCATETMPDPTLEQAFIALLQQWDSPRGESV